MEKIEIIILKDCRGSENGLTVTKFKASDEPQEVESDLAGVFIKGKLAKAVVTDKAPAPPKDKKKKEEEKQSDFEIKNKKVSPDENK